MASVLGGLLCDSPVKARNAEGVTTTDTNSDSPATTDTASIPGTPSAASANADQTQIIGPVHFTSENPTIPTAFQFLLERAHARERYTRPEWWDILKRYAQNLATVPNPSGPSLPSGTSSGPALPVGGSIGDFLVRTDGGGDWEGLQVEKPLSGAGVAGNPLTLHLADLLPPGGFVGQVLGRTADGWGWVDYAVGTTLPATGNGVLQRDNGGILSFQPLSNTGIAGVVSDDLTVTGDGTANQPLTTPGYDAWIGRFWRRTRGQETVIDATQAINRFIRVPVLDFTNFTIDDAAYGFNARLEGVVTPKYSEEYTLFYYADDLCRIWVDGKLLVDAWGTTDTGSVDVLGRSIANLGMLTKDRPYLIRVEWCQWGGDADTEGNPNRLYIGWNSASQRDEAIPTVGSSLLSEAQAGVLARVAALESNSTKLLGQPGGIATLGSDGKVPAAQLPVLSTGGEVVIGGGHLLNRTATGQAVTVEVVDDFSSDRVADRTTTMISGISNSSQTGLTYDSANQRIKITDNSSVQHFWRYGTRLIPHLQGSMDITLLSDAAGYQHIGLWIPCSADGASGYRICGFGGYLQATYWLGGTEQSGLLFRQPFTWSLGVTHTLAVDIDFVSGTSSLSVDGSLFATWVDKHFIAGGIGGFSYGAIATWDNLKITLPAAAVQGLQAGASLWTSDGLAYSDANGNIPLSSLSRVDVCNADGGVLASAWMRSGDIWTLT